MTSTLEDIKKRAENSTEGPWKDDSDGGLYMNGVGAQFMGGKEAIRNAHFAANARTDVPKLVNALERIEALLMLAEDTLGYGEGGVKMAEAIRIQIQEALS